MSSNADPGQQSGNNDSSDEYGTNPDTGECGSIESVWWQTDGDQTWTDNNGNSHDFYVDDNNW